MRHNLLALAVMFFTCQPAHSAQVISSSIPNAAVVGQGVFSYVFWDIYEATLYAPNGLWNPSEPYALTIKYYHAIDGKDIADHSVREIRKQGFTDELKLAAWNAQLKDIFPDVNRGSILSAVFYPGNQTVFYKGSLPIGSIKGDEFGKAFFGIWLSERTSAPDLRRALLGLS